MIYRLLFLFIVMNSCAVHATKRTRSLSDVKYDMHHLKDELTKLLHRSRSDQPVTRQADKQSKNEEPENNAIPISCLSPEEKKQKFINNSSAEYLKQAEAAYANKQADYLKNIIIAIERQTGLKTFRLEELSTEKLEDLFTTYRRKKKFTSAQIPLVDRLNAPVGYITQSDYLLKWCNIPENACCNDSYDKNIDKIMYNLKKIATLLEVFNLSFCNKEISDDDKYRITLRQRLKSIALLHVNLAQTLAHARCGVRANATDLNLACEYYNKATSIYLDLAEAMA